MKRIALIIGVVLTLVGGVTALTVIPDATTASGTDTNQVGYWCEHGIKYEPVATPFVVPAPPDGYVWTKLILKAGSGPDENTVIDNPVVGQSYTHSTGKGISHAILCKQLIPNNTTTTSTTTTSTTSTTTSTTIPVELNPLTVNVTTVCPDPPDTVPDIMITFGDRPDLNGQTGTLTFSTGGSTPLTFQSGQTVAVPYPASAGTGSVILVYTLGNETEDAQAVYPEGGCATTTTSSTTTTTVPGQTTTTSTTIPGQTTTTSSTVPGATTTTLPPTFNFAGATTVCRAEVPTIVITFGNALPSLAGQTGTLTMSAVNGGAVLSTQPLVYAPGTTVELLYPGTRVNPDGSIADVPGWNLNQFGLWVRDPADAYLRDGILLTYVLNPTATAIVTYPPESSACANPENPPAGVTPTTPPPGVVLLPPTL